MLRTLLLAYDGSDYAEDALSLAIELGRCLRADMHLIAVIDPHQATSGVDVAANHRYAWQRLRDAEDLVVRAGLTARLEVVEGEPAARIIEHARRVRADIIVLGHAYHGRLDQLTGASVAGRVLEHAPCAVLMPPVRRANQT